MQKRTLALISLVMSFVVLTLLLWRPATVSAQSTGDYLIVQMTPGFAANCIAVANVAMLISPGLLEWRDQATGSTIRINNSFTVARVPAGGRFADVAWLIGVDPASCRQLQR